MTTAELINNNPDAREPDEHYEHMYEQGDMSLLEAKIRSGPPVLPEPVSEPEDLVPPDDLPPLAESRAPETKFRSKPPANTWKAKAARDSGHDRKPFPSGSMEED